MTNHNKINTRDLATKQQNDINVLACSLVFSCLIIDFFFLQHNNIPEIFLMFMIFPV